MCSCQGARCRRGGWQSISITMHVLYNRIKARQSLFAIPHQPIGLFWQYNIKMAKKQTGNTHGGVREGQGRPSLGEGGRSPMLALRVPQALKDKVARNGGAAWVRQLIERAPDAD